MPQVTAAAMSGEFPLDKSPAFRRDASTGYGRSDRATW